MINQHRQSNKSQKLKDFPLKSNILNCNALGSELLQNYLKRFIDNAKIEIDKIDNNIKRLEQTQ